MKFASVLRNNWLLICLFSLGALLRIYNFWVPDLSVDEYGTWWVASGSWPDVIHRVISNGTQSPFYYSIIKLSTDLIGAGPVSLRLPSILFGIGILGLAYPLGNRIFNDRHAALLALAAFAVNETIIIYSQDARPYVLALFLTMLSFLFYVSMLREQKKIYQFGYVLATSAAYYAHYLFGFIVVIQILHLFITRGWSWLSEKRWLYPLIGMALLCLPGLPQFFSLFMRRQTLNWVPPQPWTAPIKLAIDYFDPYILSATVLAVLITGFSGSNKEERENPAGRILLLLWFFLPFLGFALIPPLFGVTLLNPRYVISALPAALFIMGWLMASAIRVGWRKWAPLAAFLVFTLILSLAPTLKRTETFAPWPRQGWAKAADLLKTFGRPDDLVFFQAGFIEGNFTAQPDPSPLLISALTWPLFANLPTGQRYQVMILPYGLNEHTLSYINSAYAEASKHRRVWVIGQGGLTPVFARQLVTNSSFHLLQNASFGTVQVLTLAREDR